MLKKLIIVESPKKARTIAKYLSSDWIVRASFGHIRQLAKDGDDKLGFEIVGNRVCCPYEPINGRARKNTSNLRNLARNVEMVLLATDPDREGEAITFHLSDALSLKNYRRVTKSEEAPSIGFADSPSRSEVGGQRVRTAGSL